MILRRGPTYAEIGANRVKSAELAHKTAHINEDWWSTTDEAQMMFLCEIQRCAPCVLKTLADAENIKEWAKCWNLCFNGNPAEWVIRHAELTRASWDQGWGRPGKWAPFSKFGRGGVIGTGTPRTPYTIELRCDYYPGEQSREQTLRL